jgi:hypothetical protein
MKNRLNTNLTLFQPVTYEIKIPGDLIDSSPDWIDHLSIRVETDSADNAVTTLTGELDQAALQGLLRRLYSLGLPLISVIYLEAN